MQPDNTSIIYLQHTLLEWWKENSRDFPWRHNRTVYRTAIAELMLRRTQANQVVPIFNEFISSFPTLSVVAAAPSAILRRMFYPLGLEWRANNILDFIAQANTRYGNDLPADIIILRTLPGIGDYVSAAIVCFADGQTYPLIDTNVVRVLGRIFGLDTSGEARRRKSMRELATQAVYELNPVDYHYALLDFAATVCTARSPKCDRCPFQNEARCDYYRLVVNPLGNL